jgi:hypothetical protein
MTPARKIGVDNAAAKNQPVDGLPQARWLYRQAGFGTSR